MKKTPPTESSVPSGQLSRLISLGKFATGIAGSMLTQGVQQVARGNRPDTKELLLTPANIKRLAHQLSEMRGAAMKVGQLLSMDAGDLLPPELSQILEQLRSDARVMPRKQLLGTLERNWGANWERQLKSFSFTPIAAASIGQVHRAQSHDGQELAIKVQYPGVRQSIRSDIDNIAIMLRLSNLIPRGVDVTPLLEEAKQQLQEEADYIKEREHIKRYQALLGGDTEFIIPDVHDSLSTRDVLAMDFTPGLSLERAKSMPQAERDRIMTRLTELLFRELFEFNCMQTDPNFANYLYDDQSGKIVLLDFGATRSFDQKRVKAYQRLMVAGMQEDLEAMEQAAIDVGYFTTSTEPKHRKLILKILMTASEPLRHEGPYPCGKLNLGKRMNESTAALSSDRTYGQITPVEVIFLHRKIGGIYMLAVRLNAQVDFAKIFAPYAQQLQRNQ
jgi:predicted unusual protein kinase regulating ubiquinone biosynthesis (AarF/ABC1/UbiB family)